MHRRVFVYGTLLAGEVNDHLLADAALLGRHRTEPCFTLFCLGAYPGVVRGGRTSVAGEIYRVGAKDLELLDRLEDYPRLYDRILIPSPFGRAWIYVYRGPLDGRPVIGSGDWRTWTGDSSSVRAAAVRTVRDPKNPRWREHLLSSGERDDSSGAMSSRFSGS
jgi:gamma-glutamylaminecyclotransferase